MYYQRATKELYSYNTFPFCFAAVPGKEERIMKLRKITAAVSAAVLTTGLLATAVSAEEEKSYVIGICQLVQHEALDAATQGFTQY